MVVAMAAIAVLLIVSEVGYAQCAMCRTALASSPEGQRLASGFNDGILFLLGAPFMVVGAMVFLIFKDRWNMSSGRSRPGKET